MAGTAVRDTLVSHLEKNVGRYMTIGEVADQLKLNPTSIGGSFFSLMKRAVVVRRKRSGSSAYEYAAGDAAAIKRAKEKTGKRFFSRRHHKPKQLAAAGNAGIKVLIEFAGASHALTLAEAKAVWVSLDVIFGK